MINLLPDQEKQAIRKEYRLRVIATVLGAVLLTLCISILFLIPSYILTLYKGSVAQDSMKTNSLSQTDQKDFTEKLASAKLMATALKQDTTLLLPTEIITYITRDKSEKVHITSMTYGTEDGKTLAIRIQGISDDRQALVDFTNILKTEKGIATVDLPVSSFAKDSDIPFSISITTK